MSVIEILEEIRALSIEERKQLMKLMVDTLTEAPTPDEPQAHSLKELRGLGKGIWEGIDAQEYVDQLRDEWDTRP